MIAYIIDREDDLLDLAHSLGQPVSSRLNSPLIDLLTPLQKQNAHPQSLSANFGVNEFPYHTDGAYFIKPPRYIILRYIQGIENPTPTTLCNLTDVSEGDQKLLQHSIWKVRSIKSFYSTILSQDQRFYRFDNGVMQPLNKANDNSTILSSIVSGLPIQTIEWEINKTVVVDNWKYLHNRPKVKPEEVNFRTLQRIMIL